MGHSETNKISNCLLFAVLVFSGFLVLSLFTPTYLNPVLKPVDARNVFLIDHGTHSSLALETKVGELVIPTPATLGRADLSGPANLENLQRQLVVGVEQIYPLRVDGAKADSLIEKLDKLHGDGRADQIVVAAYGLVFAPHPANYHWANNSSTVIASWLEELGIGVFGWRLTANWQLL